MYTGGGCLRSDTYDHTFNVIRGRGKVLGERPARVELIFFDHHSAGFGLVSKAVGGVHLVRAAPAGTAEKKSAPWPIGGKDRKSVV